MAEVKKETEDIKREIGEKSFVLDLLTELKKSNFRMFWIIIILIAMLVVTNMAWLYVFQSYDYVSYEIDATDGGNANYIGNDGDIYNGESESQNKD